MSTIVQRLESLRAVMSSSDIAALIVPSQDPHFSEYPPARFQTRGYMSGFHGSAGTLVVTRERAGLWTDSRYFLEAEDALVNTTIELFRMQTPGTPEWSRWLCDVLTVGARVGIDRRVLSINEEDRLSRTFHDAGLVLAPIADPFVAVWPDRPELPASLVKIHAQQFVGVSLQDKISRLREEMTEHDCTANVISTLDDIAWLLNLRGNDVDFNPVFLAYLIVTKTDVWLVSDLRHFDAEVREYLRLYDVAIVAYDEIYKRLGTLSGRILLDGDRTSVAVRDSLGKAATTILAPQPSTAHKARKHKQEIANLREAMKRDGAALVRFFVWLEDRIANGDAVTEKSAADHLTAIRSEGVNFVSNSFRPISAANAHGAIIHYSVTDATSAAITSPGVYLIDSGGQYLDGTTDVTRTIGLGEASSLLLEDYALVLRGMIALSETRFPKGWSGRDLDAIARLPLWRAGRNYGHGTGHGVGYYLNVHEGPQRIAPNAPDYPLKNGMIVSNEPGIYRTGQYGIRIENLLLVREDEKTDFCAFLSFETLTLCPFDRSLISPSLFSDAEIDWINTYHQRVRDELVPLLAETERAWLEKAVRPITRSDA